MAFPSPFKSYEETQEARFGIWFGTELPNSYGNIGNELLEAREQSAWFDLSFRTVIEVRGNDALNFVENLSSNLVISLATGQSALTAFLNPQAKVIATAYVLRTESGVWLETQADIAEKLIGYLEKFVFSEDVSFHNQKAEQLLFGIEGPRSKEELASLGIPRNSIPEMDQHVLIKIDNLDALLWTRYWGKKGGFTMIAPPKSMDMIWNRIIQKKNKKTSLAGMEALNILRLENGVPWYGADMNENYLLPETGLEEIINYNKGCYPGQEIIARIKSRGQLKRRLAQFVIDTQVPPPPETPIFLNDQEIGHVTSSAFDPTANKVIALGYAKIESLNPKNKFKISQVGAVLKNR